jgi:adenylylsulfate kinase
MQKKGWVIWLTGYSGAGKTTIANELRNKILAHSRLCEILDGDQIREHLSHGLTYTKEDRGINVFRIAFLAELLSRNGIHVLVAAIAPYREHRALIRDKFENFAEVYVRCPIQVCEMRDVKGLYKKARTGQIQHFTGVSDPYEEPLCPEIICNTDEEQVHESVEKIFKFLEGKVSI